jgi:tripartite-type tricarboxylate transporter receptor subunit TctC
MTWALPWRHAAGIVRRSIFVAVSLALLWPAAALHAQEAVADYPSRQVRILSPHSPGGLGDTFARLIAQHLSTRFGQPVIVENRPGASEVIGAQAAAKSAPDGYTIFFATDTGMISNLATKKSLPYDPVKDFAPLAMLLRTPLYLVVHPSLNVKTVQELIALAKAQPGKLTYASIGTGSLQHLAGTMLQSQAKVDLVHVPYKGSGPATVDVVSGQVSMMFQGAASALPHVRSGKLVALASTGRVRTAPTPNLPTMIEAGLPDYEMTSWFGLFMPAGVPRPIIDKLNREVVELLRAPATREKYAPFGIELAPSTPDELGAQMRKDIPFWTRLIRDAGIEPE